MSIFPVYLYLGPENGRKKEALQELQEQITKANGEPPEKHRLYAFESDSEAILTLVQNGSLFAAHTLVIVNNAEALNKKADVTSLVNYIKNPNQSATLVLLSDENKIETKIQSAAPKSGVRVFWEMFENEKKGWLMKTFQNLGHSITPEGAEFFLEMVENTTDVLKNEASRVSLFLGQGAEVTLEKLETFLDHSREETVFSLFNRIIDDNLEGALEVLRKILLSSSPGQGVGLLGGLQFQVRRILEFKNRLHRHPDPGSVFKEMRVFGKRNQSALRKADKAWTAARCQEVLCLIEEYEIRMRSYRVEFQKMLLELFLIQTMVNHGRIVPKPVWFYPPNELGFTL
jgi:DNA polymerase-3 subunit delta